MAGLDLSKQVGPLPLGAWIVVVGGGLGIAYYTRKSGTGTDPEPEIDTSGQPGVGTGAVGGWTPTSPSGTPASNTNPTTNEEWAYQAKQLLIGLGYPATTVSSAIDKYVNGLTPSIQEYTLVGIALAKIGPLPQTLPTGPAEPTPTPTKPTTYNPVAGSKRGYGWYRVVKGDSAASIAKKYGINIATYYLFNGGYRIVPGQYVKVRGGSNPGWHPYNGN